LRTVASGDRVKLDFACSLPNGELAATTSKSLTKDPNVIKSSIFIPYKSGEPYQLVAGPAKQIANKNSSFEDDIITRLSQLVVGLKEGDERKVILTAAVAEGSASSDGVLKMAKVRQRPKELRMPREQFVANTRSQPELGKEFTLDPLFPGRVTEITDTEVVVRFRLKDEVTETSTPFGEGTISETSSGYEIHIDAKQGRLVRSGPIVGRISQVDEKSITVDYRDHFGGESLACELHVVKVEPGEQSAPDHSGTIATQRGNK
jgi:FKBP-type peptidyl-prolyl cis-trans isomerase 2